MVINDLRQWQHDSRLNERTRRLAGDAAEQIERLKAALKPLAGIALRSDAYPDCKVDHICDYNLSKYFSVEDIMAARKATGAKNAQVADEQKGERP